MLRPWLVASVLALAGVASCKDASDRPPAGGRGAFVPYVEEPKGINDPLETTRDKMEAYRADVAAEKPAKDATKGDQRDPEWVPAEHKTGAARWKDVGVYVDGKPVGFLTWGELPITLAPTWVKDKVSAEKRPGTDDPGWRWARQRHYKFTDYLRALGVDVRKVKELHLYGPKLSQTNIVPGKDLLGRAADGFMFRFGANTYGKPIPQIPDGFGNGKTPDKIAGVMIYIRKRPPTLVRNEGLELDGALQTGVPYYGEPIRGGVRVYLDDRLAAIIKRQELDVTQATRDEDGELVWTLADVLAAQGADTRKVVEVWAIRDEKRAEKWPGAELATMTFSATAQAKGGVLLTADKIRANAIALHTRALQPSEIPVVTSDDE